MNNFKFNLKGQLKEVNLPEYKALWPLFETIVNSIQSIEDSRNSKNGKIIITANRISDHQPELDGTDESAPFFEFIVRDNGDGFNKMNYDSFLEAYSNLKISKGCKGIGRFLWLKAFSKVHVNSNYYEENNWYKRDFYFSADNGIEPEANFISSDNYDYFTTVTLTDFSVKYRKKAPASLEVLGKKIIEHCLAYFLNRECPNIILRDDSGKEINLNQLFSNTIKETLHQPPMLA